MRDPASRSWHQEYVPRQDAETGTPVLQLTSAPMIHETIYPQAAVFTPDSRCFIYSRRQAPDLPREYWIADLATLQLRKLTDEPGACGPVISPDGRWMYYMVEKPQVELRRLSLDTYERETWITTDLIRTAQDPGTIRSDGQCYVTWGQRRPGIWAVVRFDIEARVASLVVEGDALCDPAPQYCLADCNDLLIRETHGCRFDGTGRYLSVAAGLGADLHVIADDGSNLRDVNLGGSDLEMIQEHQCWLGGTRRVVSTLLRRDTPDQAFRSDRLVATVPGTPDLDLLAHGRAFAHPAVTRDGHWWVCDEHGTADLYFGSVLTRQYRLLAHTGASFGVPQYTHPHPCLSPDGYWVIYNSDVTGVPQVYAVRIDN